MSVYCLIEISIQDTKLYEEYMSRVPDVIKKYNGRYIIRSSNITPVSNDWTPDRIILIEFDSMVQLTQCFTSEEYKKIAPLREKSTKTRSIIIEN